VALKRKSTTVLAALVLTVAASAAFAQDNKSADDQQPQAEQTLQAAPEPEKSKCVTSNTDFKEKGRAATFEVELVNSCDIRLKCTVDAFVIGARGQAQGHGTLILAPAAKGQSTRKAYVMKVKSAGGMANVSHSCKSI
jgi:hypothetical protein